MMDRFVPIEIFARTAVSALALGVLEAALLAAVVYLTIRASRPSATTRHVLWWMVLWAGSVLPLVSIGASLRHIEHRQAVTPTGVARGERSERTTIDITIAPRHDSRGGAALAPAWTDAALAPARTDAAWPMGSAFAAAWARLRAMPYAATTLVGAWLLISIAAQLALARGLVALRRIKRDATPLDESILRRLRRWRQSTRIGRPVAVSVSNAVDVPVAVGFRTPTILLPARVVEVEEIADIDQIAMHEYAHLNRYDDWTNLAQRVLERLFWFNPIVALVGRQISLEREIACDDWVIAQTGRAHRYATCLWKLVESSRLPATPIVAPGALLTPRQITIRIEQLLDSRRNALPRLSPFGALAVGALCAVLVVAAALRAPAIAIVDPVPATVPPSASAPAPATEPRPISAPSPASAPSPRPERKAYVFERRELHVASDASPAAVATAVADAVAAREHDVVKATVATPLREGVKTIAGIGEAMGLDMAASMTNGIAGAWSPCETASTGTRHLDRETIAHSFGCDLHGADLRGLDLHGIAITGADLHDADLRGANLRGVKFTGSDLHGARLDGADLSDASFVGCELRGIDLSRALLDGTHIVGSSIRGANVSGARLRSLVDGCDGCDLRGLDLHGQDLHDIRLAGADLRGADLHAADLRGARLEAVDLRGANVAGIKLDGAILEHCDLAGLTGIQNTIDP